MLYRGSAANSSALHALHNILQGSVLAVGWSPPAAAAAAGGEPSVQLHSLSADGTLLLWAALPLPLLELFPAGAARQGGGGVGGGGGIAAWGAAGGKLSKTLASPLDVGSRLGAAAVAAAAAGLPAALAALFPAASQQRQWLTAFALPPQDCVAQAARATGTAAGAGHLLAVACKGGALAVLQAAPAAAATVAAAAAAEVELKLLWVSGGSISSTTGLGEAVRWVSYWRSCLAN